MNRLGDLMRCILFREQPLTRFVRKVTKGEAFTFDVFLKKGTEYIVSGKISGGRGTARMSLGDSAGTALPVHRDGGGTCFSVTPEEDGAYTIWSTVQPEAGKRKPVIFTIFVRLSLPMPPYLTGLTAPSAYHARGPAQPEHAVAEREDDEREARQSGAG